MMKENKSTHDKHEHAANMNWLQALTLSDLPGITVKVLNAALPVIRY